MEKQNTKHIEDDFLSGLIGKSETFNPSDDFTEKVMALIPKALPVEVIEKEGFKLWHYVGLAAGLIALVYFIVTFDLATFFNQMAGAGTDGGINYVSMFGNFISTFNKAFSAFHFSSISLMIVISIAVLYFGDMFLKKWSKSNADATFA